MTHATARRLAWVAFGSIACLYVLGSVLFFLSRQPDTLGQVLFGLATFSFPLVGILILSRHAKNVIGWILLAIGLSWSLGVQDSIGALSSYAHYLQATGSLHADLVAVLGAWLWVPAVGLMGTFLILLFPDGRLPSPRWNGVAWVAAIGMIGTSAVGLVTPRSLAEEGFPGLTNPLGLTMLEPVLGPLQLFFLLIPLCILASAFGLIVRFRRSRGSERLQLKWLTAAAVTVASLFCLALLTSVNAPWGAAISPTLSRILENVMVSSFGLIPVAVGIAILKYRLYDIDVVINKTVVFGALAAFITAVYVAVVVGVGAIAGSGGKPNLALSIAATAVVAVAFQPVRERVQRLANRLVYGERASPYEVLTRFSRSLAGVVSVEDVLPEIARHTAEGLGARQVLVTVLLPEGEKTASYPEEVTPKGHVRKAIPVTFRDEPVGEIAITKERSEPLTAQEHKLLEQLSAHAGVVLHNLRLALELRARLDELTAQADDLRDSRERLVSAADTSRRAIEQAIRESVEQQLVAIAGELAAAETAMPTDPRRATGSLEAIATRTSEALEALRDLARGIYPPLLADKGLVMALEAHIRKAGLDATLHIGDGLSEERFERAVETACYFCIREAVGNVLTHAPGAPAGVSIERLGDRLSFSVRDTGPGFDPAAVPFGQGLQSMADRMAAEGGELTVDSLRGKGTTVEGWLPMGVMEPA